MESEFEGSAAMSMFLLPGLNDEIKYKLMLSISTKMLQSNKFNYLFTIIDFIKFYFLPPVALAREGVVVVEVEVPEVAFLVLFLVGLAGFELPEVDVFALIGDEVLAFLASFPEITLEALEGAVCEVCENVSSLPIEGVFNWSKESSPLSFSEPAAAIFIITLLPLNDKMRAFFQNY